MRNLHSPCNTGAVQIRPANAADIPAIVRVHVTAWDAAKEGLELPTRRAPEQRTESWTSYLERGESALLVAEQDGAVAGFVAFGLSRDDDRRGEVEIYTLYVDPGSWGQGVGSVLMAEVPVGATVSLWVSERNARARRFYARHGFVADGAQESGLHVPVIRVVRPPID